MTPLPTNGPPPNPVPLPAEGSNIPKVELPSGILHVPGYSGSYGRWQLWWMAVTAAASGGPRNFALFVWAILSGPFRR